MTVKSYRHLISLSCVFFISLVARYLYLWSFNDGDLARLIYPDERNYYVAGAKLFLEQGWSYFLSQRSLWNGPLNILWVSAFAIDIELIKIANIICLSFVGLLLWDLCRCVFNVKVAYISLFLYSCNLPLLHFGGTILSEPPFIVLLIFSVWFLVKVSPSNIFYIFVSGLMLGFASLVRPTTQLFPLFLLVASFCWFLFFRTKIHFKQSLVFLLGASLVLIPYFVKNYHLFGKVGIANGSGAVLYLGNDLRTDGHEPIYSGLKFDTIQITTPEAHLDTVGDRKLTKVALQRIQDHPEASGLLVVRKFFRYLFGSPEAYFYPYEDIVNFVSNSPFLAVIKKVMELGWVALVVSSTVFGILCIAKWGFVELLLVLLLTYFAVLHSVLFPIARLALPFHILCLPLASFGLSKVPLKSITLGIVVVALISFYNYPSFKHEVSDTYISYFDKVVTVTNRDIVGSKGVGFNLVADKTAYKIDSSGAYLVYKLEGFDPKINQIAMVSISGASSKSKVKAGRLSVSWSQQVDSFLEQNNSSIKIRLDEGLRHYRIPLTIPKSWGAHPIYLKLRLPKRSMGSRLGLLNFSVAT